MTRTPGTRAVLALVLLPLLSGCAATAGETAAITPTISPPLTATPSPNEQADVLTIGDSVMNGYGLPGGSDWPTMIGQRDRLTVVNLACDGAGFVSVGTCGMNFAGILATAHDITTPVVIIQSSVNDHAAEPTDLAAATASTMRQLRDAFPEARVVALSTLWTDEAHVPDAVVATTASLRTASPAADATFLDLGQPMQGHPEMISADGLHPTLLGQEAIEAAVSGVLSAASIDLTG